ncbi:MAG: MucR family transcriptional regulator [Sphingosinicella sp.]|uniref:MucR family transcriptional regulator n=1 Tax=Sphingosinicella sp. TaxID=1917971 RepID=UPI00403807ED
MDRFELIALTADIVTSHVANNSVAISDVPMLVATVHAALSGLGNDQQVKEKREPMVSVRSSVKPDSLTCLMCGKKQKLLRRHLAHAHDMNPDEYREEFGLAASYPMVAPAYSEVRQALAKKYGLGRKSQAASEGGARSKGRKDNGEAG